LNEIDIPDSVEVLGDLCFSDCTSLNRVGFGKMSRLRRIDDFGFARTRIRQFEIPKSVESFGKSVFPPQTLVLADDKASSALREWAELGSCEAGEPFVTSQGQCYECLL
jgi:hypothetical protein